MLRFFITAFAALSTWLVVGLLVSDGLIGFLFGLGAVFVSYYGRKGASNNSNNSNNQANQANQTSQDDYELDAFEREHGWEGANEQRLALSRNAQTQTQANTNTTAPDTVAMVEVLRRLASLENHVAQLQVALSKPASVTTQKPVMAQSVSVSTTSVSAASVASAALSPSQSYQTAVKPAIHPAALTPTAPAIKNSATSTTSTASTVPPTTIVSPAINRAPVSVAAASYTAPTKAAVPATPSALKNMVSSVFNGAKNWLTGGNTLVRVGIVVLFFGVAFLLKLAAANMTVPTEVRVLGVIALAIGLVGIGWRTRNNVGKQGFSYAMQGGGVGVLYLTLFASYRLYGLLPAPLVMGLLVGVAFFSAALAVLQSALPLAVLGFAGGFVAPILMSNGSGNHVALFSYYLVLNLGIAFVAFFRGWRVLNVMGFAFTFVISAMWGVSKYAPDKFNSTEPFLIAQVLIYTFIAIRYAFQRAAIAKAKDYVDGTLVFGTPLVGFGLQAALVKPYEFGLAYSAVALAGFYMALAWWLLAARPKRPGLKLLGESFLALALGFGTLAIPLALNGRWTSAAWALEGVAILWVGLKQSRFLPTFTGVALQFLGAIAFINGWSSTGGYAQGTQNMFLGAAFVAFSGLGCGALLFTHSRFAATRATNTNNNNNTDTNTPPTLSSKLFAAIKARTKPLSSVMAVWGFAWLMLSSGNYFKHVFFTAETDDFLAWSNCMVAFIAVLGLVLSHIAVKLQWKMLRNLSLLTLPALCLGAISVVISLLFNRWSQPVSGHWGGLCWPLAIVAYGLMLYRQHQTSVVQLKALEQTELSQTSLATAGTRLHDAVWNSRHWGLQSPVLWLTAGLSLLELNHWLTMGLQRIDALSDLSFALIYALEGLALIGLGLRSMGFAWLDTSRANLWVPAWVGVFLQVISVFILMVTPESLSNPRAYVGMLFLAFIAWASGWLLKAHSKLVSSAFAVAGWGWSVWAGMSVVATTQHIVMLGDEPHQRMAWVGLLSLAVYQLGAITHWRALQRCAFACLPVIGLGVLYESFRNFHWVGGRFEKNLIPLAPFDRMGWLGWFILLASLPILLYWHSHGRTVRSEANASNASNTSNTSNTSNFSNKVGNIDFLSSSPIWRAPWLWAVAYLVSRQASMTVDSLGRVIVQTDWAIFAGLMSTVAVVLATIFWQARAPLQRARNWLIAGAGPIMACLLFYVLYAMLNLAGNTPPLPYISLLNPLELGLIAVIVLAGLWLKRVQAHPITSNLLTKYGNVPRYTVLALGFLWLNSTLLRSLHHYADVPYLWQSVFSNTVARAAFTVLWSLTALSMMLFAHKRAARRWWLLGAGLMVVVVAKLFLLDLSGHGTVERIVSFMGAGILLVVMGYFAPLPPANKLSQSDASQ